MEQVATTENLKSPNKAIWLLMLNWIAAVIIEGLTCRTLTFEFGFSYVLLGTVSAIYVICSGILIGSFTKTFEKKCLAVAEQKWGSICGQVDVLLEEFKVLKTCCQFILFVSFVFGTLIVTFFTYSLIIITVEPCFVQYRFLEAQVGTFLLVTGYGLYMYFCAKSVDDCFQAFKGLLGPLRSVQKLNNLRQTVMSD